LQLFADQDLAPQFVGEVFKEDAMALRLPIQNSLKNAGSLMFFRAGYSCGEQDRRSAGPNGEASWLDRCGLSDSCRACPGGNFIVSSTGEAYDVRARGPNRKFQPSGGARGLATPARLVKLKCPRCTARHWVIDNDFRGSSLLGQRELDYDERTYGCPQCGERGTGFQVQMKTPVALTLRAHWLFEILARLLRAR
jgi:hypothetical protein